MVATEVSWAEGPDGSLTGSGYLGAGVGVGTPEVHAGTSHTVALTAREVIDWISQFT